MTINTSVRPVYTVTKATSSQRNSKPLQLKKEKRKSFYRMTERTDINKTEDVSKERRWNRGKWQIRQNTQTR